MMMMMIWYMVRMWVAGKTVSHCYTRAISECFEALYKFICLLTYHSNEMINSGFEKVN